MFFGSELEIREEKMVSIKRLVGQRQRPPLGEISEDISRDTILGLAETARRENNYALSVLYYEKIIEIWGENPDHWLEMAIMQKEMGRFDDAKKSIIHAIRLNPKDARFQLELADISIRMKYFKEAEEYYNRAAQIDPTWPLLTEKLGELKKLVKAEADREAVDREEALRKEEQLDALSRRPRGTPAR